MKAAISVVFLAILASASAVTTQQAECIQKPSCLSNSEQCLVDCFGATSDQISQIQLCGENCASLTNQSDILQCAMKCSTDFYEAAGIDLTTLESDEDSSDPTPSSSEVPTAPSVIAAASSSAIATVVSSANTTAAAPAGSSKTTSARPTASSGVDASSTDDEADSGASSVTALSSAIAVLGLSMVYRL
ncbi:hypothetical protein H4R33_001575 [Dimargaris cristalligena]|uniref:Extracellular membrane protein CFEM domain-containing protein n=1 Tax=Dimargaris cristalligena TaxID=215637 RepID=A0A4V1J4M9_9FUNG|nr:hypothetical protein H4R33_001575 [Dimargaris cristalligena]RKP36119.1 hypothetical protein BJ085DRAFT_30622 [Dimargaris cristalligena]|eukprot:RKP36119.1 hypothetical protein BJ085DRAFT_30622 [Dimargaris cristalligena]